MPLLYVDLLGVKARYQTGGVPAARRAYTVLGKVVADGLKALPQGRPVAGVVQSDAAALQFERASDAVTVGRAIFQECFRRSSKERRVWIRGVVMKGSGPKASLDKQTPLKGAPEGILERHFSTALLRAINAEQSGFRGQRLLIEESLVTPQLVNSHGWEMLDGVLKPAHRLFYSSYPQHAEKFMDVLWPMADDPSRWPGGYRRLMDRVRWATLGGESESAHASATHLLFAEIDSIVHSLGGPSTARAPVPPTH